MTPDTVHVILNDIINFVLVAVVAFNAYRSWKNGRGINNLDIKTNNMEVKLHQVAATTVVAAEAASVAAEVLTTGEQGKDHHG